MRYRLEWIQCVSVSSGFRPAATAQASTHMKLLIICLVSSELLELAKLMKEQ